MNSSASKATNRGRPIVQEKQESQKAKLMEAALSLLEDKPIREITIRELAEQADVNSAMISYYFKNKEGVFIALMDKISNQLFAQMQKMTKNPNPLRSLIVMMIQQFKENKGFARLIHEQLMVNETQLNDDFINRFPKRMAQVLPKLIMDNTAITNNKKATHAAFSLMMLIITPFIVGAVRTVAWGISDDELYGPDWAEQIYSLFMSGCAEENI